MQVTNVSIEEANVLTISRTLIPRIPLGNPISTHFTQMINSKAG